MEPVAYVKQAKIKEEKEDSNAARSVQAEAKSDLPESE